MSSVANKFRSLTRALSHSDLEDDEDDKGFGSSSIIGKSYTFFSKLSSHGHHDTNHQNQQHVNHRKLKTLLVVDHKENEWGKLFKGKSIHYDTIDIRVEQTTLSELKVFSDSEKGINVSMNVERNGSVVARSFKPDFVLLREHIRGSNKSADYKNVLLGLMHGLVPAVNSLLSTYNFMDKPVVYAELLKIQKKLGTDNFPLIEQKYYQSHEEMLLPPLLPIVVKVGSGNSGLGKVCVASPRGFQDVASLVAMTDNYATCENFLEGKFDLRILKIGQRYKVFKRKSLSESWKTNIGASAVEEIALTERYKSWADECSTLFGGLDIVSVEAIHTKDDREFIIEVNNIGNSICPDKNEEVMKAIAHVVMKRMEEDCTPSILPSPSNGGYSLNDAVQLISGPPTPSNGYARSPCMQNAYLGDNSSRADSASLSTGSNKYNENATNRAASPNQLNTFNTSVSSSTLQNNKRKSSFTGRLLSVLGD